MKHVELLNNKQHLYDCLLTCSEKDFYCQIGKDLKRLRRESVAISQSVVVACLGVIFQQVQKYEIG